MEENAQDMPYTASSNVIFYDAIMLSPSVARVLRSAWQHCFMDASTPWSMGCITAVTLGKKTLQQYGHQQKSVSSLFNKKGHCPAATLLSMVILSLSGKPRLLEQIFKDIPIYSCSFLVVIINRNAVSFHGLDGLWFFAISNHYKFQSVICKCISTVHGHKALFR
jgi:hypothetical protein